MTTLTKCATVYLEPDLHRALRLKSVETARSVSDLLNDAIRDELAGDAEDLAAFDARKNESTMGFEDFVKGKDIFRLAMNKSTGGIPA